MTTPNNLIPTELLVLKQAWNVPLVRFDQAPVHLKAFGQSHYFETIDFLIDALQKHYTRKNKTPCPEQNGRKSFLFPLALRLFGCASLSARETSGGKLFFQQSN